MYSIPIAIGIIVLFALIFLFRRQITEVLEKTLGISVPAMTTSKVTPGAFPEQKTSTLPSAPGQNDIGESTRTIGLWVILFAIYGLIAVVIWSFAQNSTNQDIRWQTLGTLMLVGTASGAVGALLGFIFGIPRTLDPASRVAVAAAAQAVPTASSQAALAANTNLERISDWLTTLLIGATLVQAQNVISWIGSLGEKFKTGLTIDTLVPLIVVYYFALAFLGTYLITRLYLTLALEQTLALLTGVTPPSGPRIDRSTKLPDGRTGTAYQATTIQAVGGTSPLKWTAPRLPQGLNIDPSSGVISGTPTVATTKDKYTVIVIDSATPPNADAFDLEIEIH